MMVRIDVADVVADTDGRALRVAAQRLAGALPGGACVSAETGQGETPGTRTVILAIVFQHREELQKARTAAVSRMFALNTAAAGVARAAGGTVAGTSVVSVKPDHTSASA
jgi:hypothetical protein